MCNLLSEFKVGYSLVPTGNRCIFFSRIFAVRPMTQIRHKKHFIVEQKQVAPHKIPDPWNALSEKMNLIPQK